MQKQEIKTITQVKQKKSYQILDAPERMQSMVETHRMIDKLQLQLQIATF